MNFYNCDEGGIFLKKGKKLLTGISSIALIASMAGCSSNQTKAPNDPECNDWEYDNDDGVWECDDSSSMRYGHSYYGGTYYDSKNNLHKSSAFKSSKSSGFGSGSTSTSFGG